MTPCIYDVSISGFTRSSIYIYIYIYDISSLRVNGVDSEKLHIYISLNVSDYWWRHTAIIRKPKVQYVMAYITAHHGSHAETLSTLQE